LKKKRIKVRKVLYSDNDSSADMTSIKYKKDVRNILTQLARKKTIKDES